jgi:hypothetical protein
MAEGGTPLDDLDTRQGRQNWMVARLGDGERDGREQELLEPDPGIHGADLDKRQDRVEWIAGRLEGKSVSTADELAQE